MSDMQQQTPGVDFNALNAQRAAQQANVGGTSDVNPGPILDTLFRIFPFLNINAHSTDGGNLNAQKAFGWLDSKNVFAGMNVRGGILGNILQQLGWGHHGGNIHNGDAASGSSGGGGGGDVHADSGGGAASGGGSNHTDFAALTQGHQFISAESHASVSIDDVGMGHGGGSHAAKVSSRGEGGGDFGLGA
jgi:hypothetical protein